MSEDQFTKLFKYMQAESGRVDQRFAEVNKRLDQITSLVDEDMNARN